jgi:cytochrome c556
MCQRLGLTFVIPVVVWSGFGCRPTPRAGESSTPARTPITLPGEAREAVLAEMRVLLGSLNGALEAASRRDTALLRAAAAAAGAATAADPELEALLPGPWLSLALQTHQGFDALASAAEHPGGAAPDTVVAQLARITASCVSCHATYRLVTR